MARTKEDRAAYSREYRKANPEKVKASRARSSKAHAEKIKAYDAEYRKANAPAIAARKASDRKTDPAKFKAWSEAWHAANPGKREEHNTALRKRRAGNGSLGRNGLTHDEVHGWSGGLCTICGVLDGTLRGAHHIDHCHTTDKVRGLLCTRCNTGLGLFKDSPKILAEAIRYLQDPPEDRRARGEPFQAPDV